MFWEKKTKIRKHIIFYGRVQGVGFRYYAVQKANQLGLTGWVKNLYDGSVEMEVEGEEPLIDQLIIFCKTVPTSGLKIWMQKASHWNMITDFTRDKRRYNMQMAVMRMHV